MVAYSNDGDWVQLNDYYSRVNNIKIKNGSVEEISKEIEEDNNAQVIEIGDDVIKNIIDKTVDEEFIFRVMQEVSDMESRAVPRIVDGNLVEGFDIKKEAQEAISKLVKEVQPVLEAQLKKITLQPN